MHSLDAYFGHLILVRMLLQRGMAGIYLIAFLTVLRQGGPLLGERGLLPIPEFLKHASFREAPSVFHWGYSDKLLQVVAWSGLAVSACALMGLTEKGPIWLSVGAWLLLYILYLSVVNVGQAFFGFGWESMLLEAGFFTAFLGPDHTVPSIVPVLCLRWMLFRTELGAGLIKLRHDTCWRDLTCLYFHYETQPVPNPLSWYFHHLPKGLHRFGVLLSHFVQVVCPFGLLAPQPVASVAGGLCIAQQLWLIVSGNYSWLNWLTAVVGLASFCDAILRPILPLATPAMHPAPVGFAVLVWAVGALTIALSVQPVLNLVSPDQRMNFSYNRYHLVNTYGAFGSVTRERHEIVVEGTTDTVPTAGTVWKEYGFKAKPGDSLRRPPQIAPYHLRLDWMIWFLPFTVLVTPRGIRVRGYERWFLRFAQKLLEGEPGVLGLMGQNPFPERAPALVRARLYRYSFTDPKTKRETGAWWTRRLLGEFLGPVSAGSLRGLWDNE